ncbi:MAG: nuclear transport factor 2 family protein [Ignavibacteriaceae bacterium]
MKIIFLYLFALPCFIYTTISAQPISLLDSLKTEWIKIYNNDHTLITDHYHDGAAILFNNKMLQGKDGIVQILSELNILTLPITNFQTAGYFENDPGNYLEMGTYITGTDILSYIIAWKNKSGKWKRELEIIYPRAFITTSVPESEFFDELKKKWIEVANTNKPDDLTKQLYSENGYYFNSFNLSKGEKEIGERYGFMLNPGWKMKSLDTKIINAVKEDIVFEIGKWQMENFAGLYTLVWKKTDDKWKILLDFNF